MDYLPSMSSDTGVRRMSPVNSQAVFLASMPDVPSNTCTQAGHKHALLNIHGLAAFSFLIRLYFKHASFFGLDHVEI